MLARAFLVVLLAISGVRAALGQTPAVTSATLPTSQLLSEPGPTFRLDVTSLPTPLTMIAYGDQRFTDPTNTRQTDPRVRQWMVNQIAAEHPAAIIMSGDIPLSGSQTNDYAVYKFETKIWRDNKLAVYPSLGNHEWSGVPATALQNWWDAFPEFTNRRWYSAQIGTRMYVLSLDSGASLLPGSDQANWIEKQIAGLPASIDFLIVTLHHPPVADVQTHIEVDHNPRPNEIALRDYLSKIAPATHAAFLVTAGHIHNYERAVVNGVTYLVSGGGAAPPYFVERTPEDLYQSKLFPNYHYVRLTLENDRLRGEMMRVVDSDAPNLSVELKDTFELMVKAR